MNLEDKVAFYYKKSRRRMMIKRAGLLTGTSSFLLKRTGKFLTNIGPLDILWAPSILGDVKKSFSKVKTGLKDITSSFFS